ncbi:MAG TPA: hypothetical protein VM030_11460, partial [Acidimicrobiales bacterium]|nr:hypothetical protein [Acidimicrobiales bacterium]
MKAGRDRFRSLRHGLELVWTAAPRELLGAVVGCVIEAMAAVAALVLGQSLLQQLVDPRPGETVGSYAGLLLGIAVSITITSGAATVIRARQDLVSELVERLAVERIVAVSTSVELASFDEPTFHDRLRRAQTDAVRRPVELTWGLLALASGSITSVGLFMVVARLVPAALPLAVAAWFPLWIATRRSSRRYHRLQVDLTAADRQRADVQRVLTTREAAPEVRVFGTGRWLSTRYAELAAER